MHLPLKIGKEKYPALTGIRALGAIAVFFDHFPISIGSAMTFNVMAFFYVLSGFLIVRIYYDQVQLTRSWLFRYFTNRFARIYPVYFLLLTLVVLLNHNFRPWLLIKNYTLTHALFHNTRDFIIEPSWSLTVEECFYFFAPFIMILTRIYNFFVPLALATLMLGLALLISRAGIVFLETPLFVFSTTFFGHYFEFFAGAYLALVVMRLEKKAPPETKASRGMGKGIKWTAAGMLGIVALMIPMGMIYSHLPLNHAAIVLLNNFLLPFPIALFYFGLIREDNALARVLSGRVFGLLGRSSYSFYLLHMILIIYISRPLLFTLFDGSRMITVLVTFILSYLVAIALFLFYEEPLNRSIRRKFALSRFARDAASAPPSQPSSAPD